MIDICNLRGFIFLKDALLVEMEPPQRDVPNSLIISDFLRMVSSSHLCRRLVPEGSKRGAKGDEMPVGRNSEMTEDRKSINSGHFTLFLLARP